MTFPRQRSGTPAFTIIELLVVLVMLALFVAMLSPLFTHSQNRSHRLACMNNQRQLLHLFEPE